MITTRDIVRSLSSCGNVHITVNDACGHVKSYRSVHNTITTSGLNMLAQSIAYLSNSPYVSGIQIQYTVNGESFTTPTVSITQRNVSTSTIPSAVATFQYYMPSNMPTTQNCTLTAANLMFDSISGEEVFAAVSLDNIEKTALDTVSIIWDISIQNSN